MITRTLTFLAVFSCFLTQNIYSNETENAEQNLVINGGFSKPMENGGIPGWKTNGNVKVLDVEGIPTLVINGGNAAASQSIPIATEWRKLKLEMRMRVKDVVPGDQTWEDSRLAMCFKDKNGNRIGDWPNVFHSSGTSDWMDCVREYLIPTNAVSLELYPANYGKSGTVEFQNIRLTVLSKRVPLADCPIPDGAGDPWNSSEAWRQKSTTREKICINGLWRIFPVLKMEDSEKQPAIGRGWGWFKVPGIWQGIKAWNLSSSAQEAILPDDIIDQMNPEKIEQVWYKRKIEIPTDWKGRDSIIEFTMLQTHANVFLDGKMAGEVWFPGGELDITNFVKPGAEMELAILVTARPLDDEGQTFMAPDRAFTNKIELKMRGITGDVFLSSRPKENKLSSIQVITSFRQKNISFNVGIGKPKFKTFSAEAKIFKDGNIVKTIESKTLSADQIDNGIFSFGNRWENPLLWDMDSPENVYNAVIIIKDSDGKLLDESLPIEFGFREFWTQGRDLYLNGTPVHLRALYVNNICDYADKASIEGCTLLCKRMKEYGFNYLITNNYSFCPGEVGYMDALFSATDRYGILASYSLPHIKDFKSKMEQPEQRERYEKLSRWLIERVWNHPSIVTYAMNHNSTGYYGDQNPLKMDGHYSLEKIADTPKDKLDYRRQAKIAENIAKSIDPTRPVYHHQSGQLGDLYTVNCYLNWAPRQERSDWLEHWSKNGIVPLFFVEWGLPHIASWSSYRGPSFIWRCNAWQSCWDSEFAASSKGEDAYTMPAEKLKLMEAEEKAWAGGKPFHWSNLSDLLSSMEHNYLDIKSWFVDDNWRSLRTWGVSAIIPWDQAALWKRVKPTQNKNNPFKYKDLQKPCIVPDSWNSGAQYIYDFGEKNAFIPTSLGLSFLRWNQPVIGFISGKKGSFTEKRHNYLPGEKVEKQLIILNDSRKPIQCNYEWKLEGNDDCNGYGKIEISAGKSAFIPFSFKLDDNTKPGQRKIIATFDFGQSPSQKDEFEIHVISLPMKNPFLNFIGLDGKEIEPLKTKSKIGLYDPLGETGTMLDAAKIPFKKISSESDLTDIQILAIGKNALENSKIPFKFDFPKIQKTPIIIFEQSYPVLTEKLALRGNIHGLREVFPTNANHPILEGISRENLRDWAGQSSSTSPYLENLPEYEAFDPVWHWQGFENTRVWRCGNKGNVASILIEKPEIGDWKPILQGGFDLQYAPLLEYQDANSNIILCQLDVSGRTENDPASLLLVRNIFKYLDEPRKKHEKSIFYAGDEKGRNILKKLEIAFNDYSAENIDKNSVLIVGPNANFADLTTKIKEGLNVLLLGLNTEEIQKIIPNLVKTTDKNVHSERIADRSIPEFAGISDSDLHWRTKPLIAAIEDTDAQSNNAIKILKLGNGKAVLCQAAPWHFDYEAKPYLRPTYRRNVFLVSRLIANLGAPSNCEFRKRLDAPLVPRVWLLPDKWVGLEDPENVGEQKKWHLPDFDDSSWLPIKVPAAFDYQREHLNDYDGYFWYRLKFQTPELTEKQQINLYLGAIDDESWVWLNGKFLGEITKTTNPSDYWCFKRQYEMTDGLLKKDGENVLVVKVNDTFKTGGIRGIPSLKRQTDSSLAYYVQDLIADDDPYRYYRW